MANHCGYIIGVKNLRPHNNADRLQILEIFGTETCVSLNVKNGDIGVYFPTDLQLSEEFCVANNLVRKKDENGNEIGGYLDPSKRNVKCIKLRGEKSDGMYLPISCFDYLNLAEPLKVGDTIDVIEGHEICRKYIPAVRAKASTCSNIKAKKGKAAISPLFAEHVDTEQLPYNLDAFKSGDEIEITLKLHGTSQRTGHLPVLKSYKMSLLDKIKSLFNKDKQYGTPIYDWSYITGTRRTVIEDFDKKSYYDSNEFRSEHAKRLEGKLHKGETVYYEVVGFQTNGVPIMASCKNSKTADKEFIKKYGAETVFSYGCSPIGWAENSLGKDNCPRSDMYVYRMTLTNEDGYTVEYSPDYMRYRCEQMGVKCVPVLWKGTVSENIWDETGMTAGEWVQSIAEQYYEGPDPIGKSHVREGVVVRIINRPTFKAYKYKNFHFKCLENIIKVDATEPDMEEAQSEMAGEM